MFYSWPSSIIILEFAGFAYDLALGGLGNTKGMKVVRSVVEDVLCENSLICFL